MASGNIVSILVELKDLASAALKGLDKSLQDTGQTIDDTSKIVKNNSDDLDDNTKGWEYLGDSVDDVDGQFETFDGFGKSVNKTLTNVGKTLSDVGDKMQTIGKTTAAFGAALTGAFAIPVISAAKFETSLAKVDTLLTDGKTTISDYTQTILGFSQEYGKSANEVSSALYQIISAQVQGIESSDLLNVSLKASIAGQSSLTDAADVTSKILNTWGGDAQRASEISDILFKTVELGVTNFGLLSQNLRGSLPLAKNLGITFEEVSAAMTVLTKTLDTASSEVALKGLFNALIQSSDKFLERGIDITKVVSEEGIIGALRALQEVTQGDTVAMQQFIPNIRALTAVMGLLNNNASAYNANLQEIQNSTGSTEVAFDKMSGTFNYAFGQLQQTVANLVIEIGTKLLPIMTDLINLLIGFSKQITSIVSSMGEWTTYILLAIGALGSFALVLGSGLAALGFMLSGIGQFLVILPKVSLFFSNFSAVIVSFTTGVATKLVVIVNSIATAFVGMLPASLVSSIAGALAVIKTALLSTWAAAGPLVVVLGTLGAAFAGFQIGNAIKDIELFGVTLEDIFTGVFNLFIQALSTLKLRLLDVGLAYAQVFGSDKDVAAWAKRINQTKDYIKNIDLMSQMIKDANKKSETQIGTLERNEVALQRQIKELKGYVNTSAEFGEGVDGMNASLEAQIKVLDGVYNSLIRNLEAQKQAYLDKGLIDQATETQEEITQLQKEQSEARLKINNSTNQQEIANNTQTSEANKKLRENQYKREQALSNEKLNTIKANTELETTLQDQLFEQGKVKADEYGKFRIQKLNEEYEANVAIKQKELDFLLENNENLSAEQINQSNILQEQLKQLEIQHQTELIQLQTQLGQQKFDAWKQQEDRKLDVLKQNLDIEKQLDEFAVQEGNITKQESIENEIARDQEFYDAKYNLANENLNKISNLYGADSQQYAQALSEKEGLEAQHQLKVQQLNKQSEQAQLQDEMAFDDAAEQANEESLGRRVKQYQQSAKIFSNDFKGRMSSVFGEILKTSIDTTQLHVARFSHIFGLELTHLESIVQQSRQALAQQGIDLTQSTSVEAKNLLQDLTGQFTNNMGALTQRFIQYYERVKGLLTDLKGEVESYEDELLRMQGDQVAIVDRDKEKELAALEEKYGEDLKNTEEYRKAKELIDQIYNQKRIEAEQQMYEALEQQQQQYVTNTTSNDQEEVSTATNIMPGLVTPSTGVSSSSSDVATDKSTSSGVAGALTRWGDAYINSVNTATVGMNDAIANVVGTAPIEQDINVNKKISVVFSGDMVSGDPIQTQKYIDNDIYPRIRENMELEGLA